MTPTDYTGWKSLYSFVASVASYDHRYDELRDFCLSRLARYRDPACSRSIRKSTPMSDSRRHAECRRLGQDVDYLSRPKQDLTTITKRRGVR